MEQLAATVLDNQKYYFNKRSRKKPQQNNFGTVLTTLAAAFQTTILHTLNLIINKTKNLSRKKL